MRTPLSSERGLDALPEHVRAFGLVHVALRRDAGRLAAASRAVGPATVRPLAAWWRRFREVIDFHHRSEDEVAWRELRRLVPGFAAEEQALRDDHVVLDDALAAVSRALAPRADLSRLTPAAARFETLLREHLRREEGIVFPVIAIGVSAGGYAAIERQILGHSSLRVRAFLQPWLFDGADAATAAQVAATIPLPIRLLGRTVWRRDYERVVAPVRALAGDRRQS